MKSLKTVLLIMASISLIIVIGGAVYEHVAVVPKWKPAPPASLTMFQGEYGLNAANFWMMIHPVTLTLLLASLISNWKTARRKYIVIATGAYVVVLAITAIWFVPELLDIVNTPYQPTTDKDLTYRAGLWEKLSLVRLILMLPLSGVLLFSLTKDTDRELV